MEAAILQCCRALTDQRASITQTRLIIFKELYAKPPLTVAELQSACIPRVNRATVYRTVRLFEAAGIIHRVAVGWKTKLELSDQFGAHHHHANCVQCGGVMQLVENPGLERKVRDLASIIGFELHSHQLELRGICSDCQ